MQNKHIKILIKTDRDSDGYPPVEFESIWAIKQDGKKGIIDNLPFYIYDLSFKDTVSYRIFNEELYFDKLLIESTYSLIRIFCKNEELMEGVKSDLEILECKWEYSNSLSLASVAIPEIISLKKIEMIISKYKEFDFIESEVACNRQQKV